MDTAPYSHQDQDADDDLITASNWAQHQHSSAAGGHHDTAQHDSSGIVFAGATTATSRHAGYFGSASDAKQSPVVGARPRTAEQRDWLQFQRHDDHDASPKSSHHAASGPKHQLLVRSSSSPEPDLLRAHHQLSGQNQQQGVPAVPAAAASGAAPTARSSTKRPPRRSVTWYNGSSRAGIAAMASSAAAGRLLQQQQPATCPQYDAAPAGPDTTASFRGVSHALSAGEAQLLLNLHRHGLQHHSYQHQPHEQQPQPQDQWQQQAELLQRPASTPPFLLQQQQLEDAAGATLPFASHRQPYMLSPEAQAAAAEAASSIQRAMAAVDRETQQLQVLQGLIRERRRLQAHARAAVARASAAAAACAAGSAATGGHLNGFLGGRLGSIETSSSTGSSAGNNNNNSGSTHASSFSTGSLGGVGDHKPAPSSHGNAPSATHSHYQHHHQQQQQPLSVRLAGGGSSSSQHMQAHCLHESTAAWAAGLRERSSSLSPRAAPCSSPTAAGGGCSPRGYYGGAAASGLARSSTGFEVAEGWMEAQAGTLHQHQQQHHRQLLPVHHHRQQGEEYHHWGQQLQQQHNGYAYHSAPPAAGVQSGYDLNPSSSAAGTQQQDELHSELHNLAGDAEQLMRLQQTLQLLRQAG